MGQEHHDAARAFAAKLGVRDGDFEALKVRGVATSDDGGEQVPAAIKAKWQRWCVRGHPDKGGNHGAFTAMGQEYSVFKAWFKSHLADVSGSREAMELCEQLGQQKKRAGEAKAAAETALAETRFEDAIDSVSVARAEFGAWITAAKPAGKTRAHVEGEVQGLERIQRAAEECIEKREKEKQQREENQAYTLGLDSVLSAVFGARHCRERPISEHFKALNASWEEAARREKELEAQIVRLNHDNARMRCEMDAQTQAHGEAANAWRQEEQMLRARADEAQAQYNALKKEVDDVLHSAGSGGFVAALKSVTGMFSRGSSTPVPSLASLRQEFDHLKAENEELTGALKKCQNDKDLLECEVKTVHELQNTVSELKNIIAARDKKIVLLEKQGDKQVDAKQRDRVLLHSADRGALANSHHREDSATPAALEPTSVERQAMETLMSGLRTATHHVERDGQAGHWCIRIPIKSGTTTPAT